jgi:hypothetical protein
MDNKEIIDVLKGMLYYSNYYPENYNKSDLEKEIMELQNKL